MTMTMPPKRLSTVGLDPDVKRRYVWVGDPGVNLAESPVAEWFGTGAGLVAREGQELTTLVCEPLRPTTLAIVYAHATMGRVVTPTPEPVDALSLVRRNFPAVYRAAVAYSVVAIENGPACARAYDAGGLRLTDEVLDWLDHQKAVVVAGDDKIPVKLIDHLGALIISDSEEDSEEGKA